MTAPLRMLVVADAPTSVGIRMALDGEAKICAEVDNPTLAIRAAKQERPDICLIGRSLCGVGMATVAGICRAAPSVALLVLAEAADEDDLLDAIRAGAIGYVPGRVDAVRLRRVVQAVVANEAVIPRAMVLDLVIELRGGVGGADALTSREIQVLGMLRRGHTTARIAERLGIRPVTVRRHVSELVHKFGVEDRAELVSSAGWSNGRGSDRAGVSGS